MELEQDNAIQARSLAHHDRTIALLTDERPGFDREQAIAAGRHLQSLGYFVYEISVREFTQKNLALIGAMLVIPHAESVPAEFAQPLKQYWLQGGQVLVLGGPLFGALIEEESGAYVRRELPASVLDAQHSGKTGDITIEGLVPTHKVYIESEVSCFLTEPGQQITRAVLQADHEQIVCPVARPYGIGYGMEHPTRFLPLIQATEDGGRAEGRRGAAAFLMLSDTRGHLRFTNGNRPGSVSSTTMGSAIGCVGLRRQDLMNVSGAPELLCDMAAAMFRGVYLFEGGATEFVYHPGDACRIGAKVLNTTQDFLNTTVRFTLRCNNRVILRTERELLAMPRTYTECSLDTELATEGDLRLETKLLMNGETIDRIEQQIFVYPRLVGKPEECIRVNGRDFELNGKQWNLLGVSYWPLFYPSLDREKYWMGWLDKSNYDPVEVERDLKLLEDMGVNCVFTRLDGNVFGRSIPQLKDFMLRLRRHNIRLSLSYANATNPLHYYPKAFRALVDKAELRGNPTLFGHDISWETGHQYFMENYLPQWTDGWVRWIKERYGSIANAEADWGCLIDRAEDGSVCALPKEQLEFDGPWRVKLCAFRRYLDDHLSRLWNDAVSDMRTVDPDHIIGYRMGCFYKDGGAALTSTNKHIDYSSLEGYSFMENEDGRFASQCVTKVSQLLTGGKPVVWVEYGNNLIGTSGNSAWSALKWDKEKLCPLPEKVEEQQTYYEQFFRMFKACDVAGTVPWWYAGGFRRVECSDCGIVAPNGTLRPVAKEYAQLGREWFLPERKHRAPDAVCSYDPDTHAAGWGNFYLGSGPIDRNENGWAAAEGRVIPGEPEYGIGVQACREAEARGQELAITSPGFGTDSSTMPVLAVGNVPYNGSNPPKYLDAEFNALYISIAGEAQRILCDGDELWVEKGATVSVSASVGNLREAVWLAGEEMVDGNVVLSAQMDGETKRYPIQRDTHYLQDAQIAWHTLFPAYTGEHVVCFKMEAVGRAVFGERRTVTFQAKPFHAKRCL